MTMRASDIIDQFIVRDDDDLRRGIAVQQVLMQVAEAIYLARTQQSLTQQQVAQRIGVERDMVARIDDADFSGDAMSVVARILTALNLSLSIRFQDDARQPLVLHMEEGASAEPRQTAEEGGTPDDVGVVVSGETSIYRPK